MKVVSFFSFKGGVGRTALMVNVGAHWAKKGYTVLLIDVGASVPTIQEAGGVPGVCGASKGARFMHQVRTGKPGEEENGESLAFRNLADYIRQDLESAQLPPKEEGEAEGKIDYVLIDCRTGFPKLLDLSLVYLADDMVVVSGLNDQNLAGLEETLQALNKRIEIGALPAAMTLVFSPVPAGEDDAVLESLKNAHAAVRKSLRSDKYGVSESPPNTHTLHYTPVLAMRDDIVMTLERPESMYAKEVEVIADELEGAQTATGFEDAQLKQARLDVFSFLDGQKPATPATRKGSELLESNPLSQLPPWWWPLRDRSMEERMKILDEKMPPNPNIAGDRETLLNKICSALSLSKAKACSKRGKPCRHIGSSSAEIRLPGEGGRTGFGLPWTKRNPSFERKRRKTVRFRWRKSICAWSLPPHGITTTPSLSSTGCPKRPACCSSPGSAR